MLKQGVTPSLSVDRIGSTSCLAAGGGSAVGGRRTATAAMARERDESTLAPHDLRVGQTVVLMKRSMVVSGWDETAHVWWENMTGERGLTQYKQSKYEKTFNALSWRLVALGL